MLLPPRHPPTIHKSIGFSNSKTYYAGHVSSRFYLYYTDRFEQMTAIDYYYGSEMKLHFEDRSSSTYSIGQFNKNMFDIRFLKTGSAKLALYFIIQGMTNLLCMCEIDLTHGRFIVHQVKEIIIEGSLN